MVLDEIIKTNEIRQDAKITNYVIMPNHIHMIIEINFLGTVPRAPTIEKFSIPTSKTIPTIIRYIKGGVTRSFNQKYNINKRIWQRNYYKHIIRNEKELYLILEYIQNNPMNWNKDPLNT